MAYRYCTEPECNAGLPAPTVKEVLTDTYSCPRCNTPQDHGESTEEVLVQFYNSVTNYITKQDKLMNSVLANVSKLTNDNRELYSMLVKLKQQQTKYTQSKEQSNGT